MDILDAMRNRYATKKFDADKKISDDNLATILESINLSPTSYGLQLFKVLHVKNEETRKALQPTAWNQTQVVDASDFLVFLARTEYSEADIDAYMNLMIETRSLEADSVKGYGDFMKNSLSGMDADTYANWTAKQPYIALGNAMTVAATLGVDSCPMEGFDAAAASGVLGLDDSGYRPVVMLAVGYRSEEDATQHAAKVRKATSELIETV